MVKNSGLGPDGPHSDITERVGYRSIITSFEQPRVDGVFLGWIPGAVCLRRDSMDNGVLSPFSLEEGTLYMHLTTHEFENEDLKQRLVRRQIGAVLQDISAPKRLTSSGSHIRLHKI